MAEIIHDYPKSSCRCYECTTKEYITPCLGIPTNLSVVNCKEPNLFECYNKLPFDANKRQPVNKNGMYYLNPQAITNKYATDFEQIDPKCPGFAPLYRSTDPRLIDPLRALSIALDRPPTDTNLKLDTIYSDPRLCNYGKNYRTYSDISAGRISYYVDKSTEDAYFGPNFVNTSEIDSYVYKDPMGSLQPTYDRNPIKCNDRINSQKNNYDYCLSWMDDSIEQREDIMSKQMETRNQQRWEPRWANLYETNCQMFKNAAITGRPNINLV